MRTLVIGFWLAGAAAASAGFTLTADQTDLAMWQETTIHLNADTGQQITLQIVVEWGFVSILTDPVAYPPLGSSGSITPFTQVGLTDSGYQVTIAGPEALSGGLIADFTFVTMDVADIVVSLYDAQSGVRLDSLILVESPEPASGVLLTAGLLILRRRRRQRTSLAGYITDNRSEAQ